MLGPERHLCDKILKFLEFKMADGRHVGNILNAITRLPMDRLGRNLGDRIPLCARYVRHDAVAMATAVT